MEILYSNHEYVDALLNIYNSVKTYYAWGAFGAPANAKNLKRYEVPDQKLMVVLLIISIHLINLFLISVLISRRTSQIFSPEKWYI